MPQEIGQKAWLGRGVAFPIAWDGAVEDLQAAAFEESVRQSILIILGTAKGERVMRPEFGCGLYDLVFEPGTATTAGNVRHTVQEALLLFEPRIDVLSIQVTPQFDTDGAKLLIDLEYRVRATNNVFNLVYPFYLERSPG